MKSAIVLVLLVMSGIILTESVRPDVYACADKEKNPPDVQAQCKRLTRGQWWSK